MFKPSWRITPFLLSCLEGIASEKTIIDRKGKPSDVKIRMAKDSFDRSVHSSTWIEGNMLTLAQVAALSAGKEVSAHERQSLEVKNCIKALRWVLDNTKRKITESDLLKLHKAMTTGLMPGDQCGRYRKVQNYIVNAKHQVIFTPPPPSRIKTDMGALFDWLKSNQHEHAVIRSAIFHHEFVTIHPFTDGNGRVARAGAQWVLLSDHYDALWTLGLDEYFARERSKYYDMIQQTRDLDGDYTYWIEYIAAGLLETIKLVSKRLQKEEYRQKDLSLTPKQKELIGLIEQKGEVGSADISKAMKINRARVNQLISPLVKSNVVIKKGTTRSVRYRLA